MLSKGRLSEQKQGTGSIRRLQPWSQRPTVFVVTIESRCFLSEPLGLACSLSVLSSLHLALFDCLAVHF